MLNRLTKTLSLALLTVVGLGTVGCANNTETGALAGGAAGAGLGAIIGNNSHGRTGAGALIGGAVGAAGGALIGNQVDRDQARRAEYEDRYYDRRYDDYYDRPVYRGDDYYYRRY